MTYLTDITGQSPDHFWSFNNDKNDTGSGASAPLHATTYNVSNSFVSGGICEDTTHCLEIDAATGRVGPSNSNEINGTSHDERLMGGWVQVPTYSDTLACVYKEGGATNNICILLLPGNALFVSLAQSSPVMDLQWFGSQPLKPGRPYHIAFRFSGSSLEDRWVAYLDGKELELFSDKTPGNTVFNSHTAQISWGDSESTLKVGSEYPSVAAIPDMKLNAWASWSASLPNDTWVWETFFGAGAIPQSSVANQAQIDALSGDTFDDQPLAIEVTAAGTYDFSNVVMHENISAHIRFTAAGTLTIRNRNGSNIDAAKCLATGGGTIIVENPQDFGIADIVAAVWDEPLSGYSTVGTTGYVLDDVHDTVKMTASDVGGLNDPSAAQIADAVWDEQKAGHTAANSYGKIVQDTEADLVGIDANVGAATLAAVAAENAATGAETAANNAETAANTAATNSANAASDAQLAKSAAETAETAADTASTQATTAANNAITASTNATAASVAASAAQVAAELNDTTLNAVAWQTGIAEAVRDVTLTGAAVGGFGEAAGLGRDQTTPAAIRDVTITGYAVDSIGEFLTFARSNAGSAALNAGNALTAVNARPSAATIASTVRDVDNSAPAVGSLGEEVSLARSNAASASTSASQAVTDVAALNDLSTADVLAQVNAGLASYDAVVPADIAGLATSAEISALNDVSTAQVRTEVDAGIAAAGLATAASVAALNDLSSADILAQVNAGLVSYDAPTKAEMDAGFAGLNDPDAVTIADAVWDEAASGHSAAGSFGEALSTASAKATAAESEAKKAKGSATLAFIMGAANLPPEGGS